MFEGSIWEKNLKNNPDLVNDVLKDVPLSRLGTPQDISNLCLWLASKEALFCTGSIFKVDGGQIRN